MLHRASAPAGLAGLCLLVSACGGSPASNVAQLGSSTNATLGTSSTNSAGSTQQSSALAYARCMRGHGVPNFPDPDGQGNFHSLTQQALGVSKQQSLTADGACKDLLSHGGTPGTQQKRQQKLAFALKLAQCIRRHGFPAFPDPSASGQHVPSGIDPNSPQFEAAETTCHKQAQQAIGLP